jgi:hypothetical protein
VADKLTAPDVESVALNESMDRILAEDVMADTRGPSRLGSGLMRFVCKWWWAIEGTRILRLTNGWAARATHRTGHHKSAVREMLSLRFRLRTFPKNLRSKIVAFVAAFPESLIHIPVSARI